MSPRREGQDSGIDDAAGSGTLIADVVDGDQTDIGRSLAPVHQRNPCPTIFRCQRGREKQRPGCGSGGFLQGGDYPAPVAGLLLKKLEPLIPDLLHLGYLVGGLRRCIRSVL